MFILSVMLDLFHLYANYVFCARNQLASEISLDTCHRSLLTLFFNNADIESGMVSSCWNFHPWLHWKLSFWQLPVQPGWKFQQNDYNTSSNLYLRLDALTRTFWVLLYISIESTTRYWYGRNHVLLYRPRARLDWQARGTLRTSPGHSGN